jgi:membrane protein DedA with SNARE-associated domain
MDGFLDFVGRFADMPVLLFMVLFLLSAANAFVPALPVEAATIFLGYLSATGRGSLAVLLTATVGGMSIGGTALFLLCRRFGPSILAKGPLRRAIRQDSLDRSAAWFRKYGIWTVFLGKLVPGMSLCSIACCGAFRLGVTRGTLAIFLSNLLFFAALGFCGLLVGNNWRQVSAWIQRSGLYSLAGLAAIAACFGLWLWMRCRKAPA